MIVMQKYKAFCAMKSLNELKLIEAEKVPLFFQHFDTRNSCFVPSCDKEQVCYFLLEQKKFGVVLT